MDLKELSSLNKLADQLSKQDIMRLHDALSVPDGVCDRESEGAHFLRFLEQVEPIRSLPFLPIPERNPTWFGGSSA